ncbi:hypothetical protein [Streptomyces sp. FIT100]|uniref:hypothetical protein n=1 Tax=Streptomyces sp. FIT100 TaxID=2837956 RepID=UPI0021C94249|nr:hypothetical protein [Streptomyces sp. FIT100]UUN30077.1 hypothetical protein KK483_29725 [Streptomyces sp. FIT100]
MLVDRSYNHEVLKASRYARIAFALCVLTAMLPLFVTMTDESREMSSTSTSALLSARFGALEAWME